MMMRLVNAQLRLQRALAFALLAALFAAGAGLVFAVAGHFSGLAQQLAESRERAGRLAAIAAMKNSVGAADAADGAAQTGDGLFLTAVSPGIARADLQGRLGAMAAGNGVSVDSAGNLPDAAEDGLTMIGLRLDISGPQEAVFRTVLDMESGVPPLILEALSVRRTGADLTGNPPQLAAQIQLRAAFRGDESAAQAGGAP